MKTRPKWLALLFLLLSVAFGASGCADYYGAYPGNGPYYGGYGPSGPGYAAHPGYGAYPGSVTVEVGDQPYYTRGRGYYVGRSYYAWTPGNWGYRHHHRYWHHGYYHRRY